MDSAGVYPVPAFAGINSSGNGNDKLTSPADNQEEVYCGIEAPEGDGWEQDPDTLDTWFSAGLWTFSTLGWPEQTSDLKTFHPTSIVAPGYEILFFWVARMILMSTYHLGQIPFKEVYIHGIVRDKQGRKFSKSLNNGIDPIEMINKYGTDALRFALVFNSAPGNDVLFDEQKVKGMKHFANKLWNISRYILMNIDPSLPSPHEGRIGGVTDADKLLHEQLQQIIRDVSNQHIHEGAQALYQFIWHDFADVYIEASKAQLQDDKLKISTQQNLLYTLITVLKLLHPFMPFLTEVLWQKLYAQKLVKDSMLMISRWPESK